MSLLDRLQSFGSFGSWRAIVNLWTVVFFAAIFYDYTHENVLADNTALLGIAGVYAAVLAIYSAEKEFRRWHHMHKSIHPGEMYTILWTLLIIVLVVCSALFNVKYRLPSEVSASYIAVITILAITRESKNYYKRTRKKSR